jgi:hypothetical protein
MNTFFDALFSTVEMGGTAVVALIVIISILRGSRNNYVRSSTYVLDSFSLHPAAMDEDPFIRISGRHEGFISWIMTLLGMETRVDLTVGAKEWALRSGSLAGMLTTSVPLGQVQETISGYQRSLMALFLTIFFALNCLWTAMGSAFVLLGLASAGSEPDREHLAAALSTELEILLVWMALAFIAGAVYYFSKRIAFGVSAERVSGIVFKRSFIGNHVVDLAQMEEAAFILNRLVRAACYKQPGVDIPPFTPTVPAERSPLLRWWMLLGSYAVLAMCAILLGDYGSGVNLAIHTDPPNTVVWLGNDFAGQTDSAGLLVLKHLPRETYSIHYQAEGYEAFVQSVTLGKIESVHPLEARLPLMRYVMRLFTTPGGVNIALDGQQVGTSNASGSLVIPSVERGRHQLSASLNGYRTENSNIKVESPRDWQVVLVSNAEAAQQEAAAHQSGIDAHLNQGRTLFRAGKYQDAVNECDAVLNTDPTNQAALALKKQIDQTRRILGQ